MSRWLITGAAGMLGQDVGYVLRRRGEPVTALAHHELDITDPMAVADRIGGHTPDVVVNCAAWTAVDAAEEHEDEALRINGSGVANLASACERHGSRLVQLSTDYVFGKTEQRSHAEDDTPAPLNAYGRTKLAGERAALGMPAGGYVVRTAWLYGAHGPSFVRTMIGRARAGASVQVVDDQRGQPTWTMDVAEQIVALIRAGAEPGVYHATSSGATTWYGLAREVFRLTGADPGLVTPVTSAAYPRPAARPRCGVLGHGAWARTGVAPIGDWADALARALPAVAAGTAWADLPPQRTGVCRARLVGGQEPRGQRLPKAWRGVVLAGKNGAGGVRPADSDIGIQWVNTVLTAGIVGRRAQIDHGGLRAQGGESMAEPFGDE
jgi:dTDP-4-dehydrorhamnose reductase